MLTKKSAKIRSEFVCLNCNYTTCDKKDYSKHIGTAKHKNNTNVDILLTTKEKKSANLTELVCNCGKKYKSRQGMYVHKKKCNFLHNGRLIDGSNLPEDQKEICKRSLSKDFQGKYYNCYCLNN